MFKCPLTYCVAVYMLCDGVADCPQGDDEEHCDHISCPGLLHCKDENICVHPLNICDGVMECLLSGDDEHLCNMGECPEFCICRGTAIYCDKKMPKLTQISVDVSALVLRDMELKENFTLQHCVKLQHLTIENSTLAGNAIYAKTLAKLSDVQHLKLTYNNIKYVRKAAFSDMHRVKVIDIQGNNLNVITSYMFNGLHSVKHFDLSKLFIKHLHSESFYGLLYCQYLDLSNNLIDIVRPQSFYGLYELYKLDLRHNPISLIHQPFVPNYNARLQVYVDYPVQCCHTQGLKQCLPDRSNPVLKSPCRNIMQSVVIRTLNICSSSLILVTTLTLLIIGSTDKKSHAYAILLQQTIISNAIPAIYMILLSVTASIYQNHFIYLNTTWLHSYLCRILRTCITVSFTQGRLLTFLIVINQLLSTRYMFKTRHYTSRHTYSMVVMAWLLSLAVGCVQGLVFNNFNIHCFPFAVSSDDLIYNAVYVISLSCVLILIIALEACLYYNIIQYVKESHNKIRHSKTKTSQSGMSSLKTNAAIVVGIELFLWSLMGAVTFYSYILSGYRYSIILISCYTQLSGLIHISFLIIRKFKLRKQ